MKLIINGSPTVASDGLTVLQLLEQHRLGEERVAVECNGEIIDAAAFANRALRDGDVLEIVRFVGGG